MIPHECACGAPINQRARVGRPAKACSKECRRRRRNECSNAIRRSQAAALRALRAGRLVPAAVAGDERPPFEPSRVEWGGLL